MIDKLNEIISKKYTPLKNGIEALAKKSAHLEKVGRSLEARIPEPLENKLRQSEDKIGKALSLNPVFVPSDECLEAIERLHIFHGVTSIDNNIIDLTNQIDELEEIVQINSDVNDDEDTEEFIKKSFKHYFRNLFNSNVSSEELEATRAEVIKRIKDESIIVEDLDIDWVDLGREFLSLLIDRRETFIAIKIKIEKSLSKVNRRFDLRHRIRHFIDKMYRYNNSDDEEGNSNETNATSEQSFIMNYLNPLHYAIKNRNGGVFRLPPNTARMGSRAA